MIDPWGRGPDNMGNNDKMKRLVYLFVGFFLASSLFLAPIAKAQGTYTAKSCNLSDISTAIAAEQAHPVDGDIISIPACPAGVAWTGSSGISQTFNNSVTIQGAGAISATTGGTSTTGSDVTVIISDLSNGTTAMNFTTVAGKSFRVTGIYFQIGAGFGAYNGVLTIGGNSSSVRIDHCHFTVPSNEGLYISGSVMGVADHDAFDSPSSSLTNDIGFHNGVGWNGGSSSDNADHSWSDTEHWGSSKFFFVEDSRFYGGDVSDAHDGARYVFRHNTVTGDGTSAQQMYTHGLTDARGRATRAAEIYDNSFTEAGNQGNPPYSLNSGSLLFWGNTVTGGYQHAVLIEYPFRTTAGGGGNYNYVPPPNGWGFCGTAAGGPTNWDGNFNSSGYACLDQPGRGSGQLLNGQPFPNASNSVTGTIAWPHEALSPVYVWNNTYSPQYYTSSSLVGVDTVSPIVSDNTEYYQQFGSLAESGSFNGTKGIGQGLLSARTSTCTAGTDPLTSGGAPGVGYWATDANTLYVCNPANTWTTYYTPYIYPHPLAVGGTTGTTVNPPTGLTVTVH